MLVILLLFYNNLIETLSANKIQFSEESLPPRWRVSLVVVVCRKPQASPAACAAKHPLFSSTSRGVAAAELISSKLDWLTAAALRRLMQLNTNTSECPALCVAAGPDRRD